MVMMLLRGVVELAIPNGRRVRYNSSLLPSVGSLEWLLRFFTLLGSSSEMKFLRIAWYSWNRD
jgi:hypothetical protein